MRNFNTSLKANHHLIIYSKSFLFVWSALYCFLCFISVFYFEMYRKGQWQWLKKGIKLVSTNTYQYLEPQKYKTKFFLSFFSLDMRQNKTETQDASILDKLTRFWNYVSIFDKLILELGIRGACVHVSSTYKYTRVNGQ